MTTGRARLTDDEYLRLIEHLAREVVEQAAVEGWLTFLPEDRDQTPLQQSINELARTLRMTHYEGDGCLEH